MASATRSLRSVASMTLAGSGDEGSGSVCSSDTWSPLESETDQSSSSAAIVEFEIWISESWKSSPSIPRSAATSSSVGGACALVLELDIGLLDLARTGADRARHPVERAQLVDDRSADARDGIGLEFDLSLGLVALDRRDQADEPVGDEIGLLDVRGQAGAHPAGDVLDQGRVRDDESLAGALVILLSVPTPQ